MAMCSRAAKSTLKKVMRLEPDILAPQDLENLSEADIKAMKKPQLKEILRVLGLPRAGNRANLIDRLHNHYKSKRDAVLEERRGEDDELNKGTDMRDLEQQGKTVTAVFGVEIEEHSEAVDFFATRSSMKHSKSGKRKKWRETDPAHFPPNFYHRDLFAANFPLINIVDVPVGYPFPVRDKFESNVLDEKETFEARMQWLSRFVEVEHTYRQPETERQTFPKHFAFLEGLWQFTNPSRKEVQHHNNICAKSKRKWSYDEIKEGSKKRKLNDEENVGFYIVPDTEEVQGPLGANRSHGDNERLLLVPEEVARLTGEDANAATGFADGVLHVFDERLLKRATPYPQVGIDPDRVACIVERKFLEDAHKWNARFQGGFYAARHCLVNINKGHGMPIYVLVMTCSLWSYGILVPEGYVQVRNGEVDMRSMLKFKQHQQITGVTSKSFDELQEQLKRGTEFYRENFLDNPQAVYADNPMLVGTYYLSSEWFSLPRAEMGNVDLPDVRRLFDGLIRVILGDSVFDMQAEDYKQRRKFRKKMVKEELYSMANVAEKA